MKNNRFTTAQLTLLGLMAAILLLMAYTPLGYLNIGPLAISFNVIPVAISAVVLGPVGGAVAGAIFGLTSFLQCIGVGGSSAMGVVLFGINPVFAFIQRFIPRLLDGICLGYIFRHAKGQQYLCGMCSNRILFRILEYSVLHVGTCRTVWKYRLCKKSDGRS